MKEFKDLQELIIKVEEIVLRIEDANESHERGRLELNRVTNDTRQAVIRMNDVIEILPKIEESVDIIVNKINGIDAEKIQNDINSSVAGIDIEFDWEEINKGMNLRLIKFFEEMHLVTFAGHINSHIDTYNLRCEQIDASMDRLQSITHSVERLETQLTDYKHSLSGLQPKNSFLKATVLASLGALSGSILTYFII